MRHVSDDENAKKGAHISILEVHAIHRQKDKGKDISFVRDRSKVGSP